MIINCHGLKLLSIDLEETLVWGEVRIQRNLIPFKKKFEFNWILTQNKNNKNQDVGAT